MEKIKNVLANKNINSWEQLTHYIQQIPYGRNANRTDFSLVLSENKGTCSSKHALLKSVSTNFTNKKVDLIIGIFKMNGINMPILKDILSQSELDYIPEAHCYLKIDNEYYDYTVKDSLYKKIKDDIMEEIVIEPNQVSDFKVEYHQNFIKDWINKNNQTKAFDEVWTIREKCINILSEN